MDSSLCLIFHTMILFMDMQEAVKCLVHEMIYYLKK